MLENIGGEVVLSVNAEMPIVSEEYWDYFVSFRFPSMKAMKDLYGSDKFSKINIHRLEGLDATWQLFPSHKSCHPNRSSHVPRTSWGIRYTSRKINNKLLLVRVLHEHFCNPVNLSGTEEERIEKVDLDLGCCLLSMPQYYKLPIVRIETRRKVFKFL